VRLEAKAMAERLGGQGGGVRCRSKAHYVVAGSGRRIRSRSPEAHGVEVLTETSGLKMIGGERSQAKVPTNEVSGRSRLDAF